VDGILMKLIAKDIGGRWLGQAAFLAYWAGFLTARPGFRARPIFYVV